MRAQGEKPTFSPPTKPFDFKKANEDLIDDEPVYHTYTGPTFWPQRRVIRVLRTYGFRCLTDERGDSFVICANVTLSSRLPLRTHLIPDRVYLEPLHDIDQEVAFVWIVGFVDDDVVVLLPNMRLRYDDKHRPIRAGDDLIILGTPEQG